MKLFLALLSILSLNAYASSGGCIATSNPNANSGAAFNHCQQYNYQTVCDADVSCSWNVTQYYKNFCSGEIAVEKPCPEGTESIAFNAGAPANPKINCCKRKGDTGGNGGSGGNEGVCCNRGGNVVPSMTPCPTEQNPHRCCNPAGNPVNPIQAATNQCKDKPGKKFKKIRKRSR